MPLLLSPSDTMILIGGGRSTPCFSTVARIEFLSSSSRMYLTCTGTCANSRSGPTQGALHSILK